jgi:hypothetical protein
MGHPPKGAPPGPNTFYTASVPCDKIDCAKKRADWINSHHIPYSFPFINSNSAAQSLAGACGLFPRFPLSAWGTTFVPFNVKTKP